MLTGELKSQVDAVWNSFATGGIANPLKVVEQITYLLFIKRLDELQTLEENKSARLGKPMERVYFLDGKDARGCAYADMRWSRLKNQAPERMFTIVSEHLFPYLREMGGENGTYAKLMADARFEIPKASLLTNIVDLLDQIPMEDRDTKGDLYEYMLSKIASAGRNGQFRTPRHIIELMVALTNPTPKDVICDPASGTCGFLMVASEHLRKNYPDIFSDVDTREHFHNTMFNGFDFDTTMLRIGSMNMLLHGIENSNVAYRDSLSTEFSADEEKYSLILANPPFSGSLDFENTAKNLLSIVRTKKTELLFIALFLRLLKPGGRAAVIVPSGVIETDSAAHRTIRKKLVEDFGLEAVIALPHWVFKPYASVATAILILNKIGKSERVWFYRVENDGFNNDSVKSEREGSNLPDMLELWKTRKTEQYKPAAGKHRYVEVSEISANDYDLCDRVYLSGYSYPPNIPLRPLSEIFDITRGSVGASNATGGDYICVTTSEEMRRHTEWHFEGEAICIPIVSSTGHGHASIKRIQYIKGKFSAATITAVMMKKPDAEIYVPYVYHYLSVHKDELLVPLMRGSANVSLNEERLGKLRIPIPLSVAEQKKIVADLVHTKEELEELKAKIAQLEIDFSQKSRELKESF
jgi:type I restriction-modification system DNA methylase subunit